MKGVSRLQSFFTRNSRGLLVHPLPHPALHLQASSPPLSPSPAVPSLSPTRGSRRPRFLAFAARVGYFDITSGRLVQLLTCPATTAFPLPGKAQAPALVKAARERMGDKRDRRRIPWANDPRNRRANSGDQHGAWIDEDNPRRENLIQCRTK